MDLDFYNDYWLHDQWDDCEDEFIRCVKDRPATITCKYCRKSGFFWIKTKNTWRLEDASGIHNCLKIKTEDVTF
jgi:hypothetical protein